MLLRYEICCTVHVRFSSSLELLTYFRNHPSAQLDDPMTTGIIIPILLFIISFITTIILHLTSSNT